MAEYFINADTGDDIGGDGSVGNPWETFAKANTEASNGDTVNVMAATATYAFASLTIKALIVQGASAATSVFDGGGAAAKWDLNDVGVSVVLNDLTFRNATTVADGGCFRLFGGTDNSWTFERCITTDMDIIAGGPVRKGGLIQFKNTGSGCSFTLIACAISNIVISGTHGYIVSNSDGNADNTIDITGCSIYLKESGATQVTSITKAPMTVTWKNSIVMDKVSIAIGNSTNVATYSDFHNVTGSPAGTGVITVDPLFVDPDNENFNLRPASPCIDTGVLV